MGWLQSDSRDGMSCIFGVVLWRRDIKSAGIRSDDVAFSCRLPGPRQVRFSISDSFRFAPIHPVLFATVLLVSEEELSGENATTTL